MPREVLELSEIGARLGLCKQRVHQIESVALAKSHQAFQIIDLVGLEAAEPILQGLEGKPLRAFEAALARVNAGRR